MKSKDLQKVVLSKYQNGDNPTKIYRDLNGGIGLRTIERWCQMIRSVKLSIPPGGPRFSRTKGNIQKVKHRYAQRKEYQLENYQWSADISERSVRRIMKKDLGLRLYKKIIEPLLSNDQKIKRKNIFKLASNKFSK